MRFMLITVSSLILQGNVQQGESLSREGRQLFVVGFYLESCQLLH